MSSMSAGALLIVKLVDIEGLSLMGMLGTAVPGEVNIRRSRLRGTPSRPSAPPQA